MDVIVLAVELLIGSSAPGPPGLSRDAHFRMLLCIQSGGTSYGMNFFEPQATYLVFSIPQITEEMTSCKPVVTAMDSAISGVLCSYAADPLVRTSPFKKRRHIV